MVSLTARAAAPVVAAIGRRLAAADSPHDMRRTIRRAGVLFAPATGVEQVDSDVGTHGGLQLTPTRDPADGRHVLQFHGGGYVFGSPEEYVGLAARVATASRATVHLPRYRQAPEHPHPAQTEDGLAAYRDVVGRHGTERLAVLGDSAGGHMVVAVLQAARDEGLPMPACAVLLSPWLDLTGTADSHTANADSELLILPPTVRACTDWYRGEHLTDDPAVSPLHGDLGGLPPTLVHASSDELLRSDAELFAEAARVAGVDVTLRVAEGLWHVWHLLAPVLPEARVALADVGRFVEQHC